MSQDLGRLLLRVGVGGMLLLHGLAKVWRGVAPIAGMLHAHGLPRAFAWGVYLGELVGPALLVLGLWTRIGGLLVAADMLVAVALAHLGALGQLGSSGGWAVELPALYFVGGLAVALLGAGRWSAGRGRWS